MCVLNTQSMIIFIFTRLMNIRKEAKLHLQGEIEQNRGDRAKVNKSNIYILCTIKIDRILEFIGFFLVYLIMIAWHHAQKKKKKNRPRANCITYYVNIIISILSRDWTIKYSSFLLASKISFVRYRLQIQSDLEMKIVRWLQEKNKKSYVRSREFTKHRASLSFYRVQITHWLFLT